jgi:predicted N-formylglutamate amidohydrolase
MAATSGTESRLLITCEHGGNRVPPRYAARFAGQRRVLASHRGFDPGSLELARRMARQLSAPLIASTVTRLLVEVNRSPDHPRLFSEFTRPLADEEKQRLLRQYYLPHRQQVSDWVAAASRSRQVIHISVHSFTPVLRGSVRRADVGLLFDPRRACESQLCRLWQRQLAARAAGWRVRRNYPYLGKSDGLTTSLRKLFADERYLGIELEVNQQWVRRRGPRWQRLQQDVIESLKQARASWSPLP